MSDNFTYRPKFMDMRVKQPGRSKSKSRAHVEPQEQRKCEHKGCDEIGGHKSPKHGGGHHWLCKRHAAEYNKKWDFFDGMTETEVKAFNEAARHGHKQTWKVGTGPVGGKKASAKLDPRNWRGRELFEDGTPDIAGRRSRGRTRLEVKALSELDLPESASPSEIRARYADYVRRFHPDSNAGDRSSEEKLARVIRAHKLLKESGLTKD